MPGQGEMSYSTAHLRTVMQNAFIIIFLVTIIGIRLFLFVRPMAGITIGPVRVHHYMWGIVGASIAIVLHVMPLFAISLALIIDELTFVCIGGSTHEDNYSTISLIGTIALSALVFVLRRQLLGLV
ncbi:MAG: hypothetical protein G01um101477_249 [Candidatus Doudnabacteria bacterium Gr01-1014_77]|uniref:Uncharacterized protein n=1 Tax=Candidatus Doudnabacteria bacterium Gr01-1014_77 TaxID=2017133 RepID=A0A554JCD8_9BACT|nr:MAG: hypothetical protein G01um101477_249 [Candidatus Doudnabacteria bacterium Gr01-1014_77]